MKAKNVSKNIGKEVVIKVPSEEVTYTSGTHLNLGLVRLKQVPIIIEDFDKNIEDVYLKNALGEYTWVHRKFIKLAKKESNND